MPEEPPHKKRRVEEEGDGENDDVMVTGTLPAPMPRPSAKPAAKPAPKRSAPRQTKIVAVPKPTPAEMDRIVEALQNLQNQSPPCRSSCGKTKGLFSSRNDTTSCSDYSLDDNLPHVQLGFKQREALLLLNEDQRVRDGCPVFSEVLAGGFWTVFACLLEFLDTAHFCPSQLWSSSFLSQKFQKIPKTHQKTQQKTRPSITGGWVGGDCIPIRGGSAENICEWVNE